MSGSDRKSVEDRERLYLLYCQTGKKVFLEAARELRDNEEIIENSIDLLIQVALQGRRSAQGGGRYAIDDSELLDQMRPLVLSGVTRWRAACRVVRTEPEHRRYAMAKRLDRKYKVKDKIEQEYYEKARAVLQRAHKIFRPGRVRLGVNVARRNIKIPEARKE